MSRLTRPVIAAGILASAPIGVDAKCPPDPRPAHLVSIVVDPSNPDVEAAETVLWTEDMAIYDDLSEIDGQPVVWLR